MIAKEEVQRKKSVQELERKAETLRKEHEFLEGDVKRLSDDKETLVKEVIEKEADIQKYGSVEAKIETIISKHEEEKRELQAQHSAELNKLQQASIQEIQEREQRITDQDKSLAELQGMIENMEKTLESMGRKQEEEQKEKDKRKIEQIKRMATLKKSIVTGLMVVGLVVSFLLLLQFNIQTWVIIASIILMALALPIYHWSSLSALVIYGLGMLIASGVIFVTLKFETLLWIIPMAWEFLMFWIDHGLGKQVSEQ
jgi:cation transport ATPase